MSPRPHTRQWDATTRHMRATGRKNNTPCALCSGPLGPIDYRTLNRQERAKGSASEHIGTV